MNSKERAEREFREIQEAIWWLAAEGIIYDSGERRNGEIVWKVVPGKGLGDLDRLEGRSG